MVVECSDNAEPIRKERLHHAYLSGLDFTPLSDNATSQQILIPFDGSSKHINDFSIKS